MMGSPTRGPSRELLLVGALAFLSVCLVSFPIEENGDVEKKVWLAHAWAQLQFPDLGANQHTLRWAVNIPAALYVGLFGSGPLAYLILNHLVFASATAGLYYLVRIITTPRVAAAAFLVWMINPFTYFVASNLMPELYTIAYLVAALVLLRSAYASGSRWVYAAAIATLFMAYGSKETNLFLMPGLGLLELLRRRWDRVFIMIAVFGGGLLAETALINWILADRGLVLGRFEVLLHGDHVRDVVSNEVAEPTGLFDRWLLLADTNLDRLQYFSKFLYWGFFAASVWIAFRWIKARAMVPLRSLLSVGDEANAATLSAAWAIGLSFAFCTTFAIVSIHPVTPALPVLDRYLWPLLVPVMIALAAVLHFALEQSTLNLPSTKTGFMRMAFAAPMTGRTAALSLVALALVSTVARWGIQYGEVHIRRDGFEHGYNILTVEQYFGQARQHLLDGCTLVFPRSRPMITFLVHSFRYEEIRPPELVLTHAGRDLDGVTIDGRRLHAWPVPSSDWGALQGKLHADERDSGVYRPYALRLDGRQCENAYYMGQMDIAPSDQPLARSISPPPAPASSEQ